MGYEVSTTGSQSTQLSSYQNGSESPYQYEYDKNGNIISITQNGKKIEYEYDALHQLTREDNQLLNKTIVYRYDAGGNVTAKTEYGYTTAEEPGTATSTVTYAYENAWTDQLTSYNGESIVYDAIGNPTTYRGWTFGWSGRELTSASKGEDNISYTYNKDGMRTSKTVNGTKTSYAYQGSLLMAQQSTDKNLYFSYDSSGKAVSVNYNGTEYYYLRNGQGDIVGLLDQSGTKVVSYSYDSWGKLIETAGTLASTLGADNPLRYRGYYYDVETGFYYLQSRYYDPETGRFINADDVSMLGADGSVLSYNLYAYCLNNPVNRTDESGTWSKWATAGVIVGAVLVIAAITVLTAGVGTASLVGAVATGAAQGALIGAAAGTVAGAGIGYAVTGTVSGAVEGAAIGMGAGAVVGAVVGGSVGTNSWYNARALEFTNAGSKEVVLGRSGAYEPMAQSRGSTYFHTSDARWTEVHDMVGVGDQGMWKINKAFLKQQMSNGSTFALASNPATAGGYYYQKEVAYLVSKGIAAIPLW